MCLHEIINHIGSAGFIMGQQTGVTIRGIVTAFDWNRVGQIKAVDIAAYDDKRYRIADDHMGMQLRVLIKKRIVVDGFIGTENNKPVLYIHHFQIDTSDTMKASKNRMVR
jgi:hypothetical protein